MEEFKSLFDFEELDYFYHITSLGISDEICEKGLKMADGNLISTTIKIHENMIENPTLFVKNECGNNIRQTDSMILIGCPKEEINDIVQKNFDESDTWVEENTAKYVIPSKNILGYVDMKNYEIIHNENYEYSVGYGISL